MPSEVLKHIFDRFFTRTHHGSGIGLTFCKMAMEAFGGDITCESVEGDYTLFVLTFSSLLNT
jgi:signal transduction histidine kinase